MPFLEIARECGISGAAIHQRIRKLDDSGVILAAADRRSKMMGFDVCAHISITLKDPQLLKQTVEQLKEIPEIVEAHFITGSGNILVKLYCVDNEHLMRTIFDGILRIQGVSRPRPRSRCRKRSAAGEHRFYRGIASGGESSALPHDGDPIGLRFFMPARERVQPDSLSYPGKTRRALIFRTCRAPEPQKADILQYTRKPPAPGQRRTCRTKGKRPACFQAGHPGKQLFN